MKTFRFSPQIYLVLLGRFVSDFGRGFTLPFSAIYFKNEVGLSATVIGAGRLSFALAAIAAVFWGGYFSDRFGRRKCLLVSLLGSGLLHPLFPWARDATTYLVLSMVAGGFLALYWPVCAAMLTDLAPPAQRGRVFSFLRIAVNAGMALGIVLAGVTLEWLEGAFREPAWAYHVLFYVDGLTYLLFSAVIFAFVRETLPRETAKEYQGFRRGWSSALRDTRLVPLALLNTLFVLCYSLFDPAFPLFFLEHVGLTPSGVSLVLVVNTVMCVFLQLPAWSLVDGWPRTRILMASALFFAVGLVAFDLVALSPSNGFAIVLVAMSVFTVGELLHGPASTSLFSNLAPDHLRGTYMSVQSLSWGVGMGVGPVVAGAFFDLDWALMIWPAFALLVASSIAGFVFLGRTLPPEVDRPQGDE